MLPSMNPRNPWTSTEPLTRPATRNIHQNGAVGNQTTEFIPGSDEAGEGAEGNIVQDHCPCCGAQLDLTGISPLAMVSCPSCRQDFRALHEIAGYSLSDQIGRGMSGNVYRASGAGLQKQIAVKVLHQQLLQSPNFSANLVEESRISSVNHPHVTRVYSAGWNNGLYVINMELVTGGTLSDWVSSRGRLPEAEVLTLASQIVEGLHAAYGHGLLHRNIKPSNILFTEQGLAKVSDFGLSVDATEAAALPGDLREIPFYAAPEKTSGQGEDIRSDIYALGATLFYALTGRQPFPGQTAELVAQKHLEHRAPSVQAFAPEVSGGTSFVIARMLEKSPGKRHQTYKELLEHLRFAQSETGARKTTSIPIPPPPEEAEAEDTAEGGDSKKWLMIGGAAAAAVVLGAGVWLLVSKGHDSTPTQDITVPSSSLNAGGTNSSAPSTTSTTNTNTASNQRTFTPAKAPLSDSPLVESKFGDAIAALANGKGTDAAKLVDEVLAKSGTSKSMRCWSLTLQGIIGLHDPKAADANKAFQQLGDAAGGLDQTLGNSFKALAQIGSASDVNAGAASLSHTSFQGIGNLILGLKAWNSSRFEEASPYFQQFLSAENLRPEEAWVGMLKPVADEHAKAFGSIKAIEDKGKKARIGPDFDTVENEFRKVKGPMESLATEAAKRFHEERAAAFKDVENLSQVEVYRIVNRASGKCLTAGEFPTQAPTTAEVAVQLAAPKSGDLAQCWRLTRVGYGGFQFTCAKDCKSLAPGAAQNGDIPAATKTFAEGVAAQSFRFKKVNGNYFTFASESSKQTLSAKSASKDEASTVLKPEDSSTQEQQWEISPVPDAAKWVKPSDRYEIEWLHVVDQSPDIYRTIYDQKFSGGVGTIMDAFGAGAYVTFMIPQVKAGKYEVKVGVRRMGTRGIYQLSVGSAKGTLTNVGSEEDLYTKTQSHDEANQGVWVNTKTEDKWFKFTMTGKNQDSTGFLLGLDYIKLVPQ